MTIPIFTDSDWDIDTIRRIHDECEKIAVTEMGLKTYPNVFEIVTSEQMLDAYTSVGMPVSYNHWSFGKRYLQEEKQYRSGKGGLAYELVINSNPCINYLMETNSAAIQTLVVAHAGFGHNHFFKNNYLFREWTDAESILDYLVFAKEYIHRCEEKYGDEEVQLVLDSAHALKSQGIDRYKRPIKLNMEQERLRQKEHSDYLQRSFDPVLESTLPNKKNSTATVLDIFPSEPQENILRFIEKSSPILKQWQREIVRIVRIMSQYYYPQQQTQVLNEGFATYTHMNILNRLYDKGMITDGTMLEALAVQSGVVYQGSWETSGARFNPYTLGLAMFRDVERICNIPTDEDREWFPDIAGVNNHMNVILSIVANYRDESFIRQYLSPKLIRDFRMFAIEDLEDTSVYSVTDIHNADGYKKIRKQFADNYDYNKRQPNIQVVNANLNKNRKLELVHFSDDHNFLSEKEAKQCLLHLKKLWGFTVELKTLNPAGAMTNILSVD